MLLLLEKTNEMRWLSIPHLNSNDLYRKLGGI